MHIILLGFYLFIHTDLCSRSIDTVPTNLIDIPQTGAIDYSSITPYFALGTLPESEAEEGFDIQPAIIDATESQDVDFSFFNNPFALATFKHFPIKAKFSGYIQYAAWWSNRQAVGNADTAEIFYGAMHLFDPDCRDINAQGDANMSTIDTRLRVEFHGPPVFNAMTFAFIETDAFGYDVSLLHRFRLWHCFFQLTWEKSKLLLGQFWHPFSVIKCFPPTVTIDIGAPITPISRNPQIRYTIINGRTKLLLAAIAQQEFDSAGPMGASSIYLRNSCTPMLAARVSYNDQNHIYTGAGILFQRLRPRLESDTGYKVHESINSMQAMLFATIKFDTLEIRQQLIFAQNGNDLSLLGGFAVSEIEPITDKRKYTNLNALSYWMDINVKRKVGPGLYIGIAKNLGARTTIIPCICDLTTGIETETIYTENFAKNINTVFKCYPRIRFHILPVDFAFELEYTRATYGCIDNKGKVKNLDPVQHIRAMFASYYYF